MRNILLIFIVFPCLTLAYAEAQNPYYPQTNSQGQDVQNQGQRPPGYKPLPVTIPEGPIGDAFNRQTESFDDVMREKQELKALELQNEIRELQLEQLKKDMKYR